MRKLIRPRRFLEQRLTQVEAAISSATDTVSRRRFKTQARRIRKSIADRERIEELAARHAPVFEGVLREDEIKVLAVELFDRHDAYTQRVAYKLWPGVLENANMIEEHDAQHDPVPGPAGRSAESAQGRDG